MDNTKRKALEQAGWKVGDAKDFLGLTEAEDQLIGLRLELSRAIRQIRTNHGYSQKAVAQAIGSTQPRVARIEAAEADVSLDQMFRAFFAAGGTLATLVAPRQGRTKPTKAAPRVKKSAPNR
jgi:predicted XRE-type DNA-binding protein